MFNNKGQSLVLFILIIPILLGIITLVIDIGMVINQKNEIDNNIEFILEYGLDKINKEDTTISEEDTKNLVNYLEVLLNYNLKDSENKLMYDDDKIIISSNTYVEGIFSNILDIKGFQIKSSYQGYWDNDKRVIKKLI